MKVVLFDPTEKYVFGEFGNTFFPSLGLGYIAGSLRRVGHEVDLVNVNSQDDLNVLHCNKYDLIGITGNSNQLPGIFGLAKTCKNIDPTVPVVVGGGVATAFPDYVLRHDPIDYVVIGEGELTIAKLLSVVDEGGDFASIPGLGWKLDGEICINDRRGQILNLDYLTFPAHDLLVYSLNGGSRRRKIDGKYASMITTRGCNYACHYCGVNVVHGRGMRYKGVSGVLSEIEYLVNSGVQYVIFWDDLFTANRNRVVSLCAGLRDYPVTWSCITRMDCVDIDLLKQMHGAGCESILFGMESGDLCKLASYGKNVRVDPNEVVKQVKHAGIKVVLSMMIGFPGDTRDSILRDVDFLHRIKPNLAYFRIVSPYPGTSFYYSMLDSGRISRFEDWSIENYAGNPCGYPTVCDNLTREELQEIQNDISEINDLFKW